MAGGKHFMAPTTFALALLPSNLSRNPLPYTDVPMFLGTCVPMYPLGARERHFTDLYFMICKTFALALLPCYLSRNPVQPPGTGRALHTDWDGDKNHNQIDFDTKRCIVCEHRSKKGCLVFYWCFEKLTHRQGIAHRLRW